MICQSKYANIQCNTVLLVWGLLGFASLTDHSYVPIFDPFFFHAHCMCPAERQSCDEREKEAPCPRHVNLLLCITEVYLSLPPSLFSLFSLPPPHHYFPFFLNCKASNLTCLVCLCSCQHRSLTATLHSCSSLSCEVHMDIQFSHQFRIYGKMVCPTNIHTHVQCSPACVGLA